MLMTTKLYSSKMGQAVLMEDNRVPLRLGNITEQLERNRNSLESKTLKRLISLNNKFERIFPPLQLQN